MPSFRFSLTVLLLSVSLVGAQTKNDTAATAKDEKPARYDDKLAHQPSPLPDRIILTWSQNPATTQSVTWRTDTSVKAAIGQIAISEDANGFDDLNLRKTKDGIIPIRPDPERVKTVHAVTTPLTSDLNESHRHSLTFVDLKPNTKYVYRVGDGVNWSEWFEFQTPSTHPQPLKFIYFGDAQNEVKSHWSRVVRGAFTDMPKAHFILHAGDLINSANRDGEWGEWHQAAGWINGMIPSIAVPGNHEYYAAPRTEANPQPKRSLSQLWKPHFTLPENGPEGLEETVYFLDIQGVRIICLNSNERHEEQVPWLRECLSNNPCRWTVVCFHHPMYSTAASRQKGEEGKAVRVHWRPVFDEFGVDLVLQGHDHSYGRSGLMREDNLLEGTQLISKKGTVYCVSVSGPKMYELGQQTWMKQSSTRKQLYQLITIDGSRLHYEARTANGTLHDLFELRKAESGVNTLVEREELEKELCELPRPDQANAGGDQSTKVGAVLGGAAFLYVMSRVTLRRIRRKSLAPLTSDDKIG